MKKLTRVVLQADKPTPNGHVYPEAVLRSAVEKAQKLVETGRWLGNADGKTPVVLSEVTHKITALRMEGTAMVAEIEFLDTPRGLMAQQMLDAVGESLPGARVRLVPSGRGSTTQAGVVEDYVLESIHTEFEPELRDVREENEELRALFERQHTRVREATQRWREATGKHLTQPDLGTLVQWLLDGRDAVERENAELKALLGDKATGPRSPSALYEENLKLKAAIRHHAVQLDDDRCWLDDQRLYAAAGIDSDDVNTTLPPKDEFLANCARFHASRQHPKHKYVTFDERLKEALVKAAESDDFVKGVQRTLEQKLEPAMELVSAQGALIELGAVAKAFEAVQKRTVEQHPAGGEKMIAELMVKGMKVLTSVVSKRIEDLKVEVQKLELK